MSRWKEQLLLGAVSVASVFALWRRNRKTKVSCRKSELGGRGFQLHLTSFCDSRISQEVRDEEELITRMAKWPPLLARQMVSLPPSSTSSSSPAFTITQFNVLADSLSGADPNLGGFVKTPPEALDWASRKHRFGFGMLVSFRRDR